MIAPYYFGSEREFMEGCSSEGASAGFTNRPPVFTNRLIGRRKDLF
jgi:hypothetical protein